MEIDKYNLRARVYPVIVAFIMPILSILILESLSVNNLLTFMPLAGVLALVALFSSIARASGKTVEERLFSEWGGAPTTLQLLYKYSCLNSLVLDKIRNKLEIVCEGVKFLSKEEENGNVDKATEICEYAVLQLRQLTRDKVKFYMVFNENIFYGFFRNLYALRGFSIFLSICVVCYALVVVCIDDSRIASCIWVVILNVISVSIMMFFITKKSIKAAGNSYAKALLEACFMLECTGK